MADQLNIFWWGEITVVVATQNVFVFFALSKKRFEAGFGLSNFKFGRQIAGESNGRSNCANTEECDEKGNVGSAVIEEGHQLQRSEEELYFVRIDGVEKTSGGIKYTAPVIVKRETADRRPMKM